MANINSVSNGIDVNAIVASYMEVEKLRVSRLEKTRAEHEYQLAGYDQFNALLKKFSQTVDNIGSVINTNSWKISSSNDAVLSTVLTGNNVSPSQYTVNVTQLAQAQQIASSAFSTDNGALGLTDTLTIQTGSGNFSQAISASDSLETIRDNINKSTNNPGVTATILATTSNTGTAEYRLILSSSQTGIANEMQLGGSALTSLGLTNEIKAAQDALFSFNGFDVTRSSNTVSDLLDGITFTLNAANSTAIITIAADNANKNDNIKNAVHTLVDAYNSLIDIIDKNQSTKILRDSTYSAVKLNLQNTMGRMLGTGSVQNLFDLGVKTAESHPSYNADGVEYVSTGKLIIDDDVLSATLYNKYEDTRSFFTNASSGFVTQFKDALYEITKSGGNISNREQTIKEQESRIDHKISWEESRLDFVKDKLIQQYSALNLFIQHYQQISNFLEQQLNQLGNKK